MSGFAAFARRANSWFVPLVLLVASWSAQDGVRRIATEETDFIPPPPPYIGVVLDPRILQRFLGIRLVAADLIWMDTLIKSDMTHEKDGFTPIYRAFKAILILDPDNVYAYLYGGMYLAVIKDDTKGAAIILHEGAEYLEAHPAQADDNWQIPFTLGYNLIFEQNDVEEGSRWIKRAVTSTKAPAIVRQMAEHVSTERGQLEIASRVLTDLYRRVTHPEEKRRIEDKLTKIAAQEELLELNERFQNFLTSTGAYAFSRRRQFDAFMRSLNHPKRDLQGRPLDIGESGKIVVVPQ